MQIEYLPDAVNDLNYWAKTGNITSIKKMKQLLQAIETEPYKGIGKPEALKYSFTGLWSRRINLKDRLIYAIHNNKIVVYSLIGHYE